MNAIESQTPGTESPRLQSPGIHALFHPESVAVVGASRKPGSIGAAIVRNLKRDGFPGPIYPINPNAEDVQGLKAYPTVQAVGTAVDLAVIAVPARLVEGCVDDCIQAGAISLVIITAGFAESSSEGRDAEGRILARVRKAGIRMVGPNCMGHINTDPAVRLNTTFTPLWPPEGNIGILTQSGALGLTILDNVKQLNLGISSFISVGNKADVSGNDLLGYWAEDPRTDVIVLYLESFGNPQKFARIAPEVVRKKPIVCVKAGRSVAGVRAASSHSAALASLDVAVDALFEQAGVIRTNTLEELFDVAALLATQPLPCGPNVGVVSNAGGPAILLADACEGRGLKLPTLAEDTLAQLRAFLPPHAGLANPIDLVASDSPEQFEQCVRIIGNDPGIDAVVVIFIPPLISTQPELVAQGIAKGVGQIPDSKPVQTVFLSVRGTPQLLSSGPRRKIPSYSYPENAAMALAAAHQYARWKSRPFGASFALTDDAVGNMRRIVDRAIRAKDREGWLDIADISELLTAAGIRFVQTASVAIDQVRDRMVEIGFPMVVKAVTPGLIHKSDVGGVILGIENPDQLWGACEQLRTNMARVGIQLERVLLQRQIDDGLEALVGMTSDPVFGPLLVCGMGGVQVELIKDVSFRLVPVTDRDAEEMIADLKLSPLLDGYRGSPPADRAALIDIILRISALVEIVPELRELDLNPIKLLRPGEGAIVVDGRMRISDRNPIERGTSIGI